MFRDEPLTIGTSVEVGSFIIETDDDNVCDDNVAGDDESIVSDSLPVDIEPTSVVVECIEPLDFVDAVLSVVVADDDNDVLVVVLRVVVVVVGVGDGVGSRSQGFVESYADAQRSLDPDSLECTCTITPDLVSAKVGSFFAKQKKNQIKNQIKIKTQFILKPVSNLCAV